VSKSSPPAARTLSGGRHAKASGKAGFKSRRVGADPTPPTFALPVVERLAPIERAKVEKVAVRLPRSRLPKNQLSWP
jgi:hypothetical protein